jgi:hypothetical protein
MQAVMTTAVAGRGPLAAVRVELRGPAAAPAAPGGLFILSGCGAAA